MPEIEKAINENKRWAMFEGSSKPDLFIESDKSILIVEGKLTEPHTTKNTLYIRNRNQMLRHIQGAIEYERRNNINKKIFALYIVPDGFSEIKELKDKRHFSEVICNESVKITDQNDIKRIISCYYGCTTWEKIEEKFNITFRAIIEKH